MEPANYPGQRGTHGVQLASGAPTNPLASDVLEQRIKEALNRTYQVIGMDLWGDRTPPRSHIRAVVPDGNSLELYGQDRIAVDAFRTMTKAEKSRILKATFG